MHGFLLSADFFTNFYRFKNYFLKQISVSISLDSNQAQQFVGSDLGPNGLKRLSADGVCQ